MLSPADLPNDIDALKALLLVSERLIRERDDQVAGLTAQLTTRAAEIEHLKLQIADHPVNRVDEFLPWNCTQQIKPA